MTMLYRKALPELIKWKEKENTCLLVKGARQVGKTKLIEEFIKGFRSYLEIDFTKNLEALSLLLEVRNYDDFINRLTLISGNKVLGKGDILFLDEIQYYYEIREDRIKADPEFRERYIDIITLSKDIAERGSFRMILSGSMLGVSVFNVNHNPTGYLKELTMYPMDFEEFALANGINQGLIDEAKEAFEKRVMVAESLNQLLLRRFNEYVFVGGYPAAVQGYVDDPSLDMTSSALGIIDDWYKADIIKYASREDRLVILEMYNLLPSEITMKNRKFVKSHLDVPNFKNIDLKDRFLWLKSSGIAIPTYNVSNPIYPLAISKDSKIVKLFMGDVGLLTHKLFDKEAKRRLIVDKTGFDLGAAYENAAAELLYGHGHDTYFHSNKKRGEIDFMIERNMEAIPIEIKSYSPDKKSGRFNHAALDNLLEAHQEIKQAWVFGINNFKQESSKVSNFPIYMIDFVRR